MGPAAMDTHEKLKRLADEARYDLSCACGTRGGPDHRRRSKDWLWLYPASVPGGGTSVLLKTLLSNACTNDCRYCPLRAGRDTRRCTLAPEEVARVQRVPGPPPERNFAITRRRSVIECCIGWLKECRRIGTRFEKLALNVLAMIKLAIIRRYLRVLDLSDRT